MRRPLTFALVAAGACFGARTASAQQNSAIAEQLFRDGRDLMAQGQTDAACEKFAASDRLAPAIGTKLNLGVCREKQGKTATAWSLFTEVESTAARAGDTTRARIAHEHAAALAPQLKKIVVEVPTPPAGMVVKLDGTVLPSGALGTEIPIDPGEHDLAVTAPGKKTWEQSKLSLGPSATTVHVRVELEDEAAPRAEAPAPVPAPVLAPIPETAPAPAPAPSERGDVAPPPAEQPANANTNSGRIFGFALGGAGVLSLGIAGYYGLTALSRKSDEANYPVGSQERHTVYDQAGTAQMWGLVFAGFGAAALGAGVYLVVTSHPDSPHAGSAWRVAPLVERGGGGALVEGAF